LSADNVNHQDRRLQVKVQPGAGRNEVAGFSGGVLQIKIAAPPEKGRANRELIDFLSRLLDVRKSAIAIVKGATSRNKLIAVEGLTASEILRRLSV
jgi:uncharacterized protein (TIGR00251 family)